MDVPHLEAAASLAQSMSNMVTPQQRKAAESTLLALANAPLESLCALLEQTQHDYLLFHAASGLKAAVVRLWNDVPRSRTTQLCAQCIGFLSSRATAGTLRPFVREQLLITVAVVVKRSWLDPGEDGAAARNLVFEQAVGLARTDSVALQRLACALLLALLHEFASPEKATCLGLAWETHEECKRAFEGPALTSVFSLALDCLRVHTTTAAAATTPLGSDTLNVIAAYAQLCEAVLLWTFCEAPSTSSSAAPRRFTAGIDNTSLAPNKLPPLSPDGNWHAMLVEGQTLETLVELHTLLRRCNNADSALLHTGQCLMRLASLRGPVFASKGDIHQYRVRVMGALERVMGDSVALAETAAEASQSLGAELYDVAVDLHTLAHAVSALVIQCDMAYLCTHDQAPVVQSFLHMLTRATVAAMRHGVCGDVDEPSTQWCDEALTVFLDGWVLLTQSVSEIPSGFWTPYAEHVFRSYVESRMRAAERDAELDDDIDEDCVDGDIEQYAEQLGGVAALARVALEPCVGILQTMCGEGIEQLRAVAAAGDTAVPPVLAERLHWILLVTGYTLADDSSGERAVVPDEIVRYCRVRTGEEPSEQGACVGPDADDGQTNPVVRLAQTALGVAELENTFLERGAVGLVSPSLAETCAWFLARWVHTYLMHDDRESGNRVFSRTLVSAYGCDTYGPAYVDMMLRKISLNLHAWAGERAVAAETAGLLLALSDVGACARRCTVQSGQLVLLARQLLDPSTANMASEVRRSVAAGITANAADAQDPHHSVKALWHATATETLTHIVSGDGFAARTAQEPAVMLSLIAVCDILRGVSGSTTSDNWSGIYACVYPLLQALPFLFVVYRADVSCAVVDSALDASVAFVLHTVPYLPALELAQVLSASLDAVRVYSENHQEFSIASFDDDGGDGQGEGGGRDGKENRGGERERSLSGHTENLRMLLTLMSHLLSRDYLDLACEVLVHDSSGDGETDVGAVVVRALQHLLPFVTVSTLRDPSLATEFFQVLAHVCETHADQLRLLPPVLAHRVYRALVQAIYGTFGMDAARKSLESISGMASEAASSPSSVSEVVSGQLIEMRSALFELVCRLPMNTLLMGDAGDALFSLYCADPNGFVGMIGSAAESLAGDAVVHERFCRAVQTVLLLGGGEGGNGDATLKPIVTSRVMRRMFEERLERFCAIVRPILCVS